MKIKQIGSCVSNIKMIQSYVFTEAKFRFSVYEMRVLYNVVRVLQANLRGEKLMEYKYSIDTCLFGDVAVRMPIVAFFNPDETVSSNYSAVKNALLLLSKKTIEYQNEKEWGVIHLVSLLKFDENTGFVKFYIHSELAKAILSFEKGWRKIEFLTVLKLSSTYAMRFYAMLSLQKKPTRAYEITYLRDMFGLTDKYPNNTHFIKYVIDSAKKELDEKSPYTFTYKKEGRGQSTTLTFIPVYQPEKEEKELAAKELESNYPSRYFLSAEFINYLKEFNFTDKEIKTHNFLLCECEKKIDDVIQYIADRKKYIELASNQKGYIIKMLQKEIKGENIYEESKVYSTNKRQATSSIPTAEDLAKKFAEEHKVK